MTASWPRSTPISSGLRPRLDGVARTTLVDPNDGESLPILEITVDEAGLGRSALEVCRRLRKGSPPVYVDMGCSTKGNWSSTLAP